MELVGQVAVHGPVGTVIVGFAGMDGEGASIAEGATTVGTLHRPTLYPPLSEWEYQLPGVTHQPIDLMAEGVLLSMLTQTKHLEIRLVVLAGQRAVPVVVNFEAVMDLEAIDGGMAAPFAAEPGTFKSGLAGLGPTVILIKGRAAGIRAEPLTACRKWGSAPLTGAGPSVRG